MKHILVINGGSSSIKFEIFEAETTFKSLAHGIADAIGLKNGHFEIQNEERHVSYKERFKNHKKALQFILESLVTNDFIEDLSSIKIVSHRVVHGGEKYKKAVLINSSVIKEIDQLSSLAPLHNPINLEGIIGCQKLLPNAKQVAVFDTSFYSELEPKAYLYALPHDLYKHHQIRRYGFHGTSHKYVTLETLKILKKPKAKIVSVHLGNGCSITASIGGTAIDTSMGFTPLEGVPMGTRSGNIDPSLPLYLQKVLGKKPEQIDYMLNHESGLKALSEISSDMRPIFEASKKSDKKAIFAIKHYSYQIAKYISAMAASMNGVDAITFTGGIGQNAWYIRKEILSYLEFLGAKIDNTKNRNNLESFNKTGSKVKLFTLETKEALQIAKESITLA